MPAAEQRPGMEQPAPEERTPATYPLLEVAAVMLRLGCTAFGGPAAHIAMLNDEVVKRRRWLTEQEYLDLFGAAGVIPGPTSTETAIHVGMRRGGVLGLWVAGICFITPAALITLGFAWAYVQFGRLPATHALLYGIKPAVVAVILSAILKLGKTAVKSVALALTGIACVTLYLLGANVISLLLGCGLVGILLTRPWRLRCLPAPGAVLWLAQAASGVIGGPVTPPAPLTIFLYFLKIGAVLFGSGYVLLAFLRHGLVEQMQWLTDQQLVDAVAVGQFTPGPVFTTATFIGYLLGRVPGAIVASLGIFLPSFMFVWITHPIVRRMRETEWSSGFLDGINIGSVALMSGVLAQLAVAAVVDWQTALVLAVCAVLVVWSNLNSAWVVLGGALSGLVLHHGG